MNHIDFHPHAYIDENNVVINIAGFQETDHDSELLNDVLSVTVGAVKVVCCCTYGQAFIGGYWLGDSFGPPPPSYKSWIWNSSTKEWEAPISEPNDGLPYKWDESTTSWIVRDPE